MSLQPSAAVQLLLRAAVLASDARLITRENRWTIDGDATEGALLVAATKAGLDLAAPDQRGTACRRNPVHVGSPPHDHAARRATASRGLLEGRR